MHAIAPFRFLARFAPAAVCALALFWAADASAQFSNHSIFFEAGYQAIDRVVGMKGGPNLGLGTTLYIEDGFDLYYRVNVGVHEEIGTRRNVVGVFPAMGVRYLISEDLFRPYLGLNLGYIYVNSDVINSVNVTLSPYAGFEYFVAPNVSLGLQGEYHRLLVLNGNSGNTFAGLGRVAFGF